MSRSRSEERLSKPTRFVLAMRSPVFEAELYGPVGEDNRQNISIEDMEPDIFKALLQFVYTDSLLAMDDLDRDEKE
ncbi:BTB/POZ and MATH domain-containing protein 3-like [Panicum miliaceum]|uniref:BTB/POZ and MATH domain-containing protein 3-like n=1 Tax=Panicum miliaceum TaxID=4540 RepID=A0A3L6RK36_PANMI|nr:BTB/POZ and MATH domain-containing protein 3-like [Panicum miliaceum]